jgi:uncharacterized membrane protein YgcG
MKRLLVLTLALLMLFTAGGCKQKAKYRKEHVKVYHLKDGRYCYKHHDPKHGDKWYWLVKSARAAGAVAEEIDLEDFFTDNVSDLDDVKGAMWVSSSSAPAAIKVEAEPSATEMQQIEQLDASNQVIVEAVVTDARGNPEVDADGNLVDPDQLAPDESFDAPTDNSDMASGESSMGDSSSSSDSSSDSGSGSSGDSGGDSGGGGDGGGD